MSEIHCNSCPTHHVLAQGSRLIMFYAGRPFPTRLTSWLSLASCGHIKYAIYNMCAEFIAPTMVAGTNKACTNPFVCSCLASRSTYLLGIGETARYYTHRNKSPCKLVATDCFATGPLVAPKLTRSASQLTRSASPVLICTTPDQCVPLAPRALLFAEGTSRRYDGSGECNPSSTSSRF